MNKRLQKKNENRKRKLMHELLDLVLDINGLGSRSQKDTGNLPTAFFNFSGHVGWVDVCVYQRGWFSGADKDQEFMTYTNNVNALAETIRNLKAVKADTEGKD